MSIITDEMVEKARDAANSLSPQDEWVMSSQIRAALTAILPDIGEAFAKVADDRQTGEQSEFGSGIDQACHDIAERIRSLVAVETKDTIP